jgi:leucyl aminopeptidase
MKVTLTTTAPLAGRSPVLIVPCCEDSFTTPLLERLDHALQGGVGLITGQREFTGKRNSAKLVHSCGRLPADRVLLVGLGREQEVTVEVWRQAAGAAAQALRGVQATGCAMVLPECLADRSAAAAAAVTGFILGCYQFAEYKTDPDRPASVAELVIHVAKAEAGVIERVVQEALILTRAVGLARDLVSGPGNVVTPAYLAEQAMELAARTGLDCSVLEREALEELGMGGLLAVAQGSAKGPRFIILEYQGRTKEGRPVVLVGKGITFDAGGISIKPAAGMEAMKTDMAGAAAVIGTLQAAAELRLPINLVGLIPTAENLPDGGAYKPGDVVRTMAGKTVEIVNTDAEGRMLLSDALHYAQRYKPAALIDLATLTGACVVALGHNATGLMGNDAGLVRALHKAGEASGERLWELPLWDDYGELMKSDIADLKNAGGPTSGTITAGWFLKQFAGKVKWAHLDIAGTAWEEKGRHYLPKGASGVGVRLLVAYLQGLAG